MFDTVLFDFEGTLVDFQWRLDAAHAELRAAFAAQGLPVEGNAEQIRLPRAGLQVRVLISYGAHWFPWYMRRLAERPANLLFVAKSMFAR